jgi:hypothetical protein
MSKTDQQLDEAEARRILEDLARTGPATARVAAIKVLREMHKDEAANAEPEPTQFERAGLYDDELGARRLPERVGA